MSRRADSGFVVTADLLLRAYAAGIFPMAESADSPEVHWVDPDIRGIIPLDGFHLPRRLKRTLVAESFEVRIDTAFDEVVAQCAAEREGRETTWINTTIKSLYSELHARGNAHSVECWRDGRMVGALYGVKLASAFFGESMFSAERDASKIALVHLIARLRAGGFRLLDTQFTTEHLKKFGAVDIHRDRYQELLTDALYDDADFFPEGFDTQEGGGTVSEVILQSLSQIS